MTSKSKKQATIVEEVKTQDISGVENIAELFNKSSVKKWIKLIDENKTIKMEDYNRKDYFVKVGDIVLDNDIAEKGAKIGQKQRKTVIKLEPTINNEDYKKKAEWIYIFLINGRIVKIGGTRDGIKGRFGSYLCGHHIPERGGSRDCSKTNGFIYNTFEFYLNLGCKVEIYGYEIPVEEIKRVVFGKEITIKIQSYHGYESVLIGEYSKTYGFVPILCDNCDPDYKD